MKTKILISLIILLSLAIVFRVEAQEIEIFSEDFEGEIENWNLDSGWEVIKENGNHVLQGTKHTFARAYLEGEVMTLEAKIKILRGALHISFRTNETAGGQTRYFLGLGQGNSYLQKEIKMKFEELASGRKGISLGAWHLVKVELESKKIRTFIDKNLLFEVEDKNLIEKGDISFETLENSLAYIDDVRVEMSVPEARELKAQDLFPNGQHQGDLTIEGRDFLILEKGQFEQFGNIYLKDSSKLIIRDATFKITHYQRLLNHWKIHLQDRASLEVENSKLLPGESKEGPTLFVIEAGGRARVTLKNSPTKLHLFIISDKAKATVENSEIVGEIGGLIGAFGKADVKIFNSRIGAVNLHIPSGASFEASGLGTGFFKKWDLHEDAKVSGIDYNITLINTELVPDKIGPGPFERGWPVFIESDAHVKIKDSTLRKVVITLRDEKAEFANFSLNKPTNFNYRDISLENIVVKGQWGIFLQGVSEVTVRDSEHFWTFIYDDSKLTLINTHMNEFDPRNFRGEIVFENSRWDTAAEILENNDFVMKGSLEIGNIGGFSWETSQVTRIYDVIGKPEIELTLIKNNEVVWSGKTDKEGRANFSLKFDDATFNDTFVLQDNLGHQQAVTFFSKTPIDMEQGFISKSIQKMKLKAPPGGPPLEKVVFLLSSLIIILSFLILFLYLRKKRRQRQG